MDEVRRQVGSDELAGRRWALVPARVGPGLDLVAEGTALRAHAVRAAVLVRTRETLAFTHVADGARDLPAAAAALERLARAAQAVLDAGGALEAVDDGFLVVGYPA